MRVSQTVVAAAIAISAVLADSTTLQSGTSKAAPAKQEAVVAEKASSSTTTTSSTSSKSKSEKVAAAEVPSSKKATTAVKNVTPKAAPAAPVAPAAPAAKPAQKKKTIVEKAAGIGKLLFGQTQRQKQRLNAKKNGQYLRKQKSADEIKTDASGTKQPASLSDPNVNVMEAFSDLVKRYAGQAKPDKAQFREDITTVFESRAEKGDLTTKQYRQSYKMRKVKPNGVGKKKRSTKKTKRDLEGGDLEARSIQSEDEIAIEAREADAFADPEAMVYEDEAELLSREPTEDYDSLIARKNSDDDDKAEKKDEEVADDDDDSSAKKKAALKKKVAAKKRLAAKKKQLAAKIKAAAAAKKKAAAGSKKGNRKSANNDDDDDGDDDDLDEDSKPTSKKGSSSAVNAKAQHKKYLKAIAKLRASIVAAQRQIDKEEKEEKKLARREILAAALLRRREDLMDDIYEYGYGSGY